MNGTAGHTDAEPGVEPATGLRARSGRRPQRPRWLVRSLGIVAVIVVISLLGVRLMASSPLVVESAVVERAAVRDELSASTAGEVIPSRRATIRASVAARVKAVQRRRGDRVRAGDVLAVLDASELDARVRQAVAGAEVARAQLRLAEERAQALGRAATTLRDLAQRGAETAKAAEDATAQAREAVAAADVARAQLAQSQSALEVARVDRARADLTAPFAGLVADVSLQPGDLVQNGQSAFELVDDSTVYVSATLDESDIHRVKVGQVATLRLDGLPDRVVPGVVAWMDAAVRRDAKGQRTLRIEVDVRPTSPAEYSLRPGMSANVDVHVAERQGVLSLPTQVIVGRGVKRSVYRIEDGIARERPVEIGMASWDRTEITSGLAEGDKVVASLDVQGLADGMPVVANPRQGR